MYVQFEVPRSSMTALLVLVVALAAVAGPPAVSVVTGWWAVRLRRWGAGLRVARARLVSYVREALRRFLDGDDQR
ncbi:hypothetical protein [Streptomyces sp. NPDC056308]|uniref:hypothetical protein n=1 Tax=Streptomyces sp. NPDC056308 TaxID=3345780 RepID=UPI0035D7B686